MQLVTCLLIYFCCLWLSSLCSHSPGVRPGRATTLLYMPACPPQLRARRCSLSHLLAPGKGCDHHARAELSPWPPRGPSPEQGSASDGPGGRARSSHCSSPWDEAAAPISQPSPLGRGGLWPENKSAAPWETKAMFTPGSSRCAGAGGRGMAVGSSRSPRPAPRHSREEAGQRAAEDPPSVGTSGPQQCSFLLLVRV